jgi:hypothetical protein
MATLRLLQRPLNNSASTNNSTTNTFSSSSIIHTITTIINLQRPLLSLQLRNKTLTKSKRKRKKEGIGEELLKSFVSMAIETFKFCFHGN